MTAASEIVMWSGGIQSWAAAKRVVRRYGRDSVILLFADTRMEDQDLYRFSREAAADVGALLVEADHGLDPWEIFEKHRFLGNHRVDLCSRILKRETLRNWLYEYVKTHDLRCSDVTIHLGMDWTEGHRLDRARQRWESDGWNVSFPLDEPPYETKDQWFDQLAQRGIARPVLYELGFPHNNCGGFCIKAGHAHFRHLLSTMPQRYAYHERKEQELRQLLGKDVAILTDRSGGRSGDNRKPLTLQEFRERIKQGHEVDLFDWGGCGCFVGE